MEMTFDPDESWFHDVYQKLATAIRRIKGVLPVYEREPDGGPVWFDDSEPEEDPPDDQQPSRSWHQFFVSPEGQAFAFETEIENIGEAVEEDEAGTNRCRISFPGAAGLAGRYRCLFSPQLRLSL